MASLEGRKRVGEARHRYSRGQSTVEFGISSIVLILLFLGLVDMSRVFYFDVSLHGAAREGARHGAWFDQANRVSPYLYDSEIKKAVDLALTGSPGISPSIYQGTCPATADGNTDYNPPFADNYYPPAGVYNTPYLYICYDKNPGVDYTAAPGNNNLRLHDLDVILLMNYGLATGFMQQQLGNQIKVAANFHMAIQGKP
jgi:Flp pilus assembly protein TadG